MNFWRGEAYQAYFDHLDSKGGFYYEVIRAALLQSNLLTPLQRWGDAPVHSIAAALFANKDQLHFFKDIGYRHDSFQHCPQGDAWSGGKCSCDPSDTFGQLSWHVLVMFTEEICRLHLSLLPEEIWKGVLVNTSHFLDSSIYYLVSYVVCCTIVYTSRRA